MHIIITYPTSATFWLNVSGRRIINKTVIEANRVKDQPELPSVAPPGSIAARIAAKLNLRLPLDILVADTNHRNNRDGWRCHLRAGALPDGSLIYIGEFDGHIIYMASPEFTFLQAARSLSMAELALLGTELCAVYVYDALAEHRQRAREAITSVDRIRGFLAKAKGAYGIKRARASARYIMEGSNSPMESRLALFATMPVRYGGMGLPVPKLNGTVVLSRKARQLYGYDTIRGDMLWWCVIFEYDSDECHTSSDEHAKDIDRQNALSEQGYTVVRASAGTVRDAEKLAGVFDSVRRKLGLRKNRHFDEAGDKRRILLRQLMSSPVEMVIKNDVYTHEAKEREAACRADVSKG